MFHNCFISWKRISDGVFEWFVLFVYIFIRKWVWIYLSQESPHSRLDWVCRIVVLSLIRSELNTYFTWQIVLRWIGRFAVAAVSVLNWMKFYLKYRNITHKHSVTSSSSPLRFGWHPINRNIECGWADFGFWIISLYSDSIHIGE